MTSADRLKYLNEIRYKDYKNKQEIIDKVKKILQPEVNIALRKLITKLQTIDSVRLYSELLQSQKVKDKIEQKKHEKQRLKDELGQKQILKFKTAGSEYESSEESNLYDEFGEKMMEDDSSQLNELEDKTKKLFSDLDQGQEENIDQVPIASSQITTPFGEESSNLQDIPQVKQKFLVAGIQEEEEAEDEPVKLFLNYQQLKQFLEKNNFRDKFLAHQLQQFNPVKFLAKAIKEIIGKHVESDEEQEEEFEIKKGEVVMEDNEEKNQDNQ